MDPFMSNEKNMSQQWNPSHFPLLDNLFGEQRLEEDPFSWWREGQESPTRTFDNNEQNTTNMNTNSNPNLNPNINPNTSWENYQEIESPTDYNNSYYPIQFTQQVPFFSSGIEERTQPKFVPFPQHPFDLSDKHLSDFMNSLSFVGDMNNQKEPKKKPKKTPLSNPKEKKISFFHYKWRLRQFRIKNKSPP